MDPACHDTLYMYLFSDVGTHVPAAMTLPSSVKTRNVHVNVMNPSGGNHVLDSCVAFVDPHNPEFEHHDRECRGELTNTLDIQHSYGDTSLTLFRDFPSCASETTLGLINDCGRVYSISNYVRPTRRDSKHMLRAIYMEIQERGHLDSIPEDSPELRCETQAAHFDIGIDMDDETIDECPWACTEPSSRYSIEELKARSIDNDWPSYDDVDPVPPLRSAIGHRSRLMVDRGLDLTCINTDFRGLLAPMSMSLDEMFLQGMSGSCVLAATKPFIPN